MASMETAVRVGMTEELRAAIDELRETRRERIATAVLAGFAAHRGVHLDPRPYTVECAIRWADALIAELDQ